LRSRFDQVTMALYVVRSRWRRISPAFTCEAAGEAAGEAQWELIQEVLIHCRSRSPHRLAVPHGYRRRGESNRNCAGRELYVDAGVGIKKGSRPWKVRGPHFWVPSENCWFEGQGRKPHHGSEIGPVHHVTRVINVSEVANCWRHCWVTADAIKRSKKHFMGKQANRALEALRRRAAYDERCAAAEANRGRESKSVTMAYLGETVFLTGKFGAQLKDDQGSLVLSHNKQVCEKWSVKDAGDGKVFLESYFGHNLKDHKGTPMLTGSADAWEKWTILDAGGKVFLRSHFGNNLSDRKGERLGMSGNFLQWEMWQLELTMPDDPDANKTGC